MTAPTGDDALREALGVALTELWEADAGEPLDDLDVFAETRDAYLDALLPVVLRYGREKAAEELRAAADDEYLTFTAIHNGQTLRCHPIDDLYDRANELAPEDPT